jgi:hypothetical protein
MPVHRGKDIHGSFYQWGSQKKYYYIPNDQLSRKRAKQLAHLQAAAITRKQTKGGNKKKAEAE